MEARDLFLVSVVSRPTGREREREVETLSESSKCSLLRFQSRLHNNIGHGHCRPAALRKQFVGTSLCGTFALP